MPAWSLAAYSAKRVRAPELMDDAGLDPAIRLQALQGIETISHWWGQREPLLREIVRLLGPPTSRRLKLIEVGAGSGHFSRWLESRLKAYNLEIQATDLWPGPGVSSLDCLSPELPEADLYFSNLLLHHLGDWELCGMLRAQSKAARLGFAHFDLQRSRMHYSIAKFRTRLAGLPEINQIDALLSIQQGFSRAELAGLIKAAGLSVELQWSFPFRWLLTLKK